MKTDRKIGKRSVAHFYRHPLIQCMSPYLGCLRGMADPVAVREVQWTPLAASTAAVLLALTGHCPLRVGCQDVLMCMGGSCCRSEQARVGTSYNGLIKALERQSSAVLPLVKASLRRHAAGAFEHLPRVHGWTLLAVDGSRIGLPRTRDHEASFGMSDNGHYPQAYLTAVMEVHTGLLWDWRIDRADASEQHHLQAMTAGLPRKALLLADAHFVGYPIWSELVAQGTPFVIRVGGNVHLLTKLWPEVDFEHHGGCADRIVYAWPKPRQRDCPPLRLRLIRLGSRSDPVYLLTNVLDTAKLSRPAVGMIYRLRWGAEMFYRTFKRTLEHVKLKSRVGRRSRLELEWGLIGMCIMTLLGIDALIKRRRNPVALSPAGLMHTLRAALLRAPVTPGLQTPKQLSKALSCAVRDGYTRRSSKKSRHRPLTVNTPRLRLHPPKLRPATPEERALALRRYPAMAA